MEGRRPRHLISPAALPQNGWNDTNARRVSLSPGYHRDPAVVNASGEPGAGHRAEHHASGDSPSALVGRNGRSAMRRHCPKGRVAPLLNTPHP